MKQQFMQFTSSPQASEKTNGTMTRAPQSPTDIPKNITSKSRKADDVDLIVGTRLRQFRKAGKFTQKELGEQVGISFKQIRKYETGENRISASMLYQLSLTLKQPIDAFFDKIENLRQQQEIGPEHPSITALAAETAEKNLDDAERLLHNYYSISDEKDRQAFLDLLRAVSLSDDFRDLDIAEN